jgi:hypothetical protein
MENPGLSQQSKLVSTGVYLGLLALFYIAYKKHHLFADYFRSKRLVTLLGNTVTVNLFQS